MHSFLLIVSLLFGTVPFNRQKADTNFIIDFIWMFIMPICYLICYLSAVFGDYGLYQLEKCGGICKLSSALFTHLGCFVYLCVHFLTLMCRKQFFLEFEGRLNEIDHILDVCKKRTNHKTIISLNTSIRQLTWLILLLIFCGDVIFDATNAFQYYGFKFYIAIMLTTFPYFATSTVQGQFISHISIISHRFKELNDLFNKINQECDKNNAPISVFDIETDIKKLSSETEGIGVRRKPNKTEHFNEDVNVFDNHYDGKSEDSTDYEDDNDNADKGKKIASDNDTSEIILPELFKLHDKILSLSVITNAKFGVQCVPYMAICFVISIFGIFLITKVIFIVPGKDPLLDYVIYIYVWWSVTTIIVAYLVLRFCCTSNAHSKQSAMIVHEIMQKKPAFMLGNDLYYNKMKSFTLQYLHWETYFQFNGIGLFALDYTFIFSTVSAATSYLIVLLQFDMTAILKNDGLMS